MKLLPYEIPPTAGLPPRWSDWLPTKLSFTQCAAQLFNLPDLQLECSGTTSLIVALNTLKQLYPTQHEVIIPAYTCPLVALAIVQCGLEIKLCDTKSGHFDFDLSALKQLISKHTLAVVPTHLGGRIANVQSLRALIQGFDITIIEDAAQALGAQVGIYGDIVFFSLAAGKGLSLYEGGLLSAKSPQMRTHLKQTHQKIIPFKWGLELKRCIELLGYTALYRPLGLYYAYGHPLRRALQANDLVNAVGDEFDIQSPLHQVSKIRQNVGARALSRLPAFIDQTKAQAQKRIIQLQKINGLHIITDTTLEQGIWPFIMLLFPDTQKRDAVLELLWKKSLGVSRLFIHALPDYAYLKHIIPQVATPNARDFAARMLTLSNSLWLNDEQFEYICQTLYKVMRS